MCLLQRFLFLSIHRLYLISFLREILKEKVLQEFLGCIFLGAHTIQTVPKHIYMRRWLNAQKRHFLMVK